MKIFNWVQRRLHHNVIKDGLAKNVKKTESIAIDNNTQALIEQVALVDVLEGWRYGILTIGTFGFDPLKPSNEQKESFILESDHEEEEDYDDQFSVNNDDDDYNDNSNNNYIEDEEGDPLIVTTFDHNFEEFRLNNIVDHCASVDGHVQLGPIVHVIETDQGKRRTTLADLFLADSDSNKKPNPIEFDLNSGKKPSSTRNKNNGLSFAKKLIPHVGEDSRPIKKLHQMMKRMLKRKIHPDLDCKVNNKSDGQNKSSKKLYEAAGESVSLLQTSDARI